MEFFLTPKAIKVCYGSVEIAGDNQKLDILCELMDME